MLFPFVGELISVLAFKVLRATAIVGVLTFMQLPPESQARSLLTVEQFTFLNVDPMPLA